MNRRLPALLLAVACLLPFIRLGIGEIQPWDESLYVIRAAACLKFGAWLDQTSYAVGHLYSATHPPFGVWLIALSQYVFGNSTFAIRFPVALAASASIYFLWLLLRRFASPGAALIAAVSVAASDLFLQFSHLAQMECFILFFGVASIYFLVLAIEQDGFGFTTLSGATLGLGLLTKFGFALFVIPFFLLLPWAICKLRAICHVLLAVIIGLAIAAPWFIMMSVRHADYWQHVTASLLTLGEGHYAPSKLAWWYYLNRLIVAMPLLVVAFFFRNSNRLTVASLAWLVTLLVGLQIVGTRMPHFAMILLTPGAILMGSCWDNAEELPSGWRKLFLLTVSLLVIAWSASEQVRLFLTGRFPWNDFIVRPEGVAAFGLTIALGIVAMKYSEAKSRMAVGFSALLLALAIGHLFSIQEKVYQNGAEQIANIVNTLPAKSRIVIIHPDFPNEEYAPQLAYYTDGWMLGWVPSKTSRAITWDSAAMNYYLPDSAREIAVITRFEDRFYHRPTSEAALWGTLTSKLRQVFSHARVYRSYVLYY